MKAPENTPPAATALPTEAGNEPNIDISEAAIAGMELEAGRPKLAPPEPGEAVTAVTAAVWSTDKRVNGLYTTQHARNSWMSISGVGWKKLATTTDSACEAMTLLAAHCREKLCRIDFAEENGQIKEIYVW